MARDSLTEKLTLEQRSKCRECVSHGVFLETVSLEDRAAGAEALRLNSLGVLKEWQRSGCS